MVEKREKTHPPSKKQKENREIGGGENGGKVEGVFRIPPAGEILPVECGGIREKQGERLDKSFTGLHRLFTILMVEPGITSPRCF